MNWEAKGEQDGDKGYARLGEMRDICAKVGVEVDAQAYARGRERGLSRYCTFDRGRDEGLAGRYYSRGVCPAVQEREFLRGHGLGTRVYQAEQELKRIQSRIEDQERKLFMARADAERKEIKDQIDDLMRDERRYRDQLRDAERAMYQRR